MKVFLPFLVYRIFHLPQYPPTHIYTHTPINTHTHLHTHTYINIHTFHTQTPTYTRQVYDYTEIFVHQRKSEVPPLFFRMALLFMPSLEGPKIDERFLSEANYNMKMGFFGLEVGVALLLVLFVLEELLSSRQQQAKVKED